MKICEQVDPSLKNFGRVCALGIFVVTVTALFPSVNAVPLNIEGPSREVANNSLTDFDLPSVSSKGCRYKADFYSSGEEVSTDEPCLHCQCKGTVVVCKLRICPEIPVPPPPGCIVVHKAKSCCSQLICQAENTKKISREQRFPTNISNETLLASVSNETRESAAFCVLDGTVYAEGSAMRSSTLCQYCFCIRGEMKCSSPQCVIPLNGCKPKFRSYACCPTNYDCGQSNETAILKTIPSSTQVPQFLKGCLVNNQFVPEGEPVLPVQLTGFGNASSATAVHPDSVCQTCFCMGGVVHCRPLECDQPIDGCTPVKEDGHCCPDRYDCSKPKGLAVGGATTVRTTTTGRGSSLSVSSSLRTMAFTEGTTELPEEEDRKEEVGESTTEEIKSSTRGYSKEEGYYVPVAITMMSDPLDEENGESTTTTTTAAATFNLDRKSGNPKEDSFERIATLITGSSEESTSLVPPTTVPGHQDEALHPKKKTRVSATTVGGFKNRSDLGSREERRSKDADELNATSPKTQAQSVEDDEREEYYAFPVFETTMPNAIESLGGATTQFAEDIIPEESTSGPQEAEVASLVVSREDTNDDAEISEQATENNYLADQDLRETTILPRYLDDELVTTLQNDLDLTETTEKLVEQQETTFLPPPASSALSTSEEPSSTTAYSTTPVTTTTSGNLEFIPFVEEDALLPLDNDTASSLDEVQSPQNSLETDAFDKLSQGVSQLPDGNVSLLKPLLLKFFNGTTEESFVMRGSTEINDDALPILVEKEDETSSPTQFNLDKVNATFGSVPTSLGSSSLYNNGYYPHGSIITDDEGPDDELHVSEGELEQINGDHDTSSPPPTTTLSPQTTTKKAEQPLKAISSIDKFIPSYAPATVQPVDIHPSRTYSKFGIQDAPLYRYDHQGSPLETNGYPYPQNSNRPQTTGIYHHRYYNEPEEIPLSRVQNPYQYYTPNNKQGSHVGGNGGGMLPQLYKNGNQFFYEDSSAALDSYEEYDAFLPNPTSGSNSLLSTPPPSALGPAHIPFRSSTPSSSGPPADNPSTHFQFLGERVRLPSYNQQRATSTPKYKYAYSNGRATTPTSYRGKMKVTTERTAAPAAVPLQPSDYKHFQAPFPFSLPRTQDDNNLLKSLGIKLSGCNVVGKMYSVGEIIEELSSDCLRCMCSDIGVHCAERKC